MNFEKFFIIDFILVLVGFLYVFFLQGSGSDKFVLINWKKNILKSEDYQNIPDLKELLNLETLAKKNGSGIQFDSLIGLWSFVKVWKSGKDAEDSIASSLLRLFSASLELRESNNSLGFDITNSIQFASLALRFIGSGDLAGSQPILSFVFERIELCLGDVVLFSRLLAIPEKKNRPFFGLIAIGDKRDWLVARGRGGGLALWVKE